MNHKILLLFLIFYTIISAAQEKPTKNGDDPQATKTTTVDFSKAQKSLIESRTQRCVARANVFQKRVNRLQKRLEEFSGKSNSYLLWKIWYGWRVKMITNRLERLKEKAAIECPPSTPKPVNTVKQADSTLCKRCLRTGKCACGGKAIRYKPCELYERITTDTKTKSKLLREYSFVDFYAIKDLKRVICDSLTKARKELKLIRLNNELNKNNNTNNSVSAAGTKTNTDLKPAEETTATATPSANTTNEELRLLQIQQLAQDSTDLANCFIGGQTFYMGTIAGFQNFADLPDDNPQQITQFNFNYSLPLKKLNGKMVCNYRKPYTFVWFRNLYFTSVLTPVTVASKLFYANGLDTAFNGKQSVYTNYQDLTQFSRLKAHVNLNVLTFISRYYSVYGNLHGGIGRCEVKYGEKSTQVNYYDYGLNLALRTKFDIPLNLVATYHLFLLDANSDLITPNLNRQYANLYKSNDAYFRQSTKNSQFNTFNLTFQYDLRALSSTNDPGTGNSNSSSPSFLYASIGYSTNRMVGPRYNQQAHNNFLTIQLGYSRNFDEIANAVKSILGLKTESSSAPVQ